MARIGKNKNAYRVLVRKSEAKKLIRISKHKWDDNVKMGHKNMVGGGVGSSGSGWG